MAGQFSIVAGPSSANQINVKCHNLFWNLHATIPPLSTDRDTYFIEENCCKAEPTLSSDIVPQMAVYLKGQQSKM